jgi:hypothetical protein
VALQETTFFNGLLRYRRSSAFILRPAVRFGAGGG